MISVIDLPQPPKKFGCDFMLDTKLYYVNPRVAHVCRFAYNVQASRHNRVCYNLLLIPPPDGYEGVEFFFSAAYQSFEEIWLDCEESSGRGLQGVTNMMALAWSRMIGG